MPAPVSATRQVDWVEVRTHVHNLETACPELAETLVPPWMQCWALVAHLCFCHCDLDVPVFAGFPVQSFWLHVDEVEAQVDDSSFQLDLLTFHEVGVREGCLSS